MPSPADPLDERGLPPGYPFRDDTEVTPRDVKTMLDDGKPVALIDCRTPQEHAIAAIDGAKLIPMQETVQRFAELKAHRDDKVVVFCHHGMRSLQVAAYLRQQGFGDVSSMAGGIDLWAIDIDPELNRY